MTEKLSPMQQEMLNRADAIFTSIGNAVSTTTEIAKEQLPDIAIQFIIFSRAYLTFIEVLFTIALIVGVWLFINVGVRNTRKMKDYYGDWAGGRYTASIFGGILSLMSFIVVFVNLKQFMLVWFAPKIFLIQSLVQLAKGII